MTPEAGRAGERTARERRPAWWRVPLLAFGFVALFAGVGAGLARLGWTMPDVATGAAALHGPLMVCGFFGVVIALERAVAIGRAWAYAGPLLAGLGTAAVMHGAAPAAPWLYLAGSVVLLAASLDVLRRQRELFMLVIAVAAGCWSVGTALWAAGAAVHQVVGWWLGFLVLTIAGERLELSRFMPPSRGAERLFAALVAAALAALVLWPQPWAPRLFGVVLVALAAWLLRHDIARRTVRQRGLTRFIAVCLLSGYFWLATGGAVIAAAGVEPGGAAYDAALHALLLGFVFAMVFGHAPIIFPAVLRVAVPYHPRFYVPLVLLHASLALRLLGDASGQFEWQRWGALLSALALLGFIASTAAAVVQGRRSPARRGTAR
ncbi:hypothetical protein [Azohydromonas sp.]|uniref:hypothetical protein n=1 Tax=Azohydromonas sp. TaxID=1872666 RepID=UPI002D1FA675|nr:hypothetical protein [Azohydromonas sp.]